MGYFIQWWGSLPPALLPYTCLTSVDEVRVSCRVNKRKSDQAVIKSAQASAKVIKPPPNPLKQAQK
ncbi:hypothetical protein M3197_01380 [Sporosarcina aquimarina]|nr:hypothetical protein [Sporosarcina aquimarina]